MHGDNMYKLLRELFPFCRSITGGGVRETFKTIARQIPLEVTEIPSGTECFDWTVPPEWNARAATLTGPDGKLVADFAANNLHLLGYSEPVEGEFTLEELRPHLYSDPRRPDHIPYLTSYYKRRWGFCLRHRQLENLKAGVYKVKIDTTLAPGSLTMAECFVPGRTDKEIFFSCYTCHPSMANDSLSGVVLNVELCKHLLARGGDHHYSYRFLFVPETIGAIAYLHRNQQRVLDKTYAGMVLTCLGDPGDFHYKKTRQGDHQLDKIVENVLKHSGKPHELIDFFLPGSDERQYSSPGFDLAVGSLMRSVYGFELYHSSGDGLEFVTADALGGTFAMYADVITALEGNFRHRNLKPFCEPFLSKYGLYQTLGAQRDLDSQIKNILNVLNYSDGTRTLAEIAERTKLNLLELVEVAKILVDKGLLERSGEPD